MTGETQSRKMNVLGSTECNIKPLSGVKRAVNASPGESAEKSQVEHHPATLPTDRIKLDEGWTEILRAIRTIKRLQHQVSPLQPVSREGELPLSFAQQRLWLLHQLEPDSPAYNTAQAYRVTGPLYIAALAQSLNEIVRRHEILQTTFSSVEGRPVQVIAPALTLQRTQGKLLRLSVVDVQDLPAPERETEVLRLVTELVRQPVDLAQWPLLRASMLRLGQQEHVLVLVTHQILFDGQAWGVFNREISALYEAFSAGKPSSLPELPLQYADFAIWQWEWLQGEVLETLLSYWKRQLDGTLPLLMLPTHRPRPAVQTSQSARQSLALPKTLTDALKALSQQEGATLFATLLAALKMLLHRYTEQEDILVFSPTIGRNLPAVRKLIGPFSNLLLLRSDLSGDPSFRALLKRVRKVALEAYAHQDLPFEQLIENLRLEGDLGHASPFQVIFIFENAPTPSPELSGLTVSPLGVDTGTTKFDLSLFMTDTKQGLVGTLVYKPDLFDAAAITRMLEHFQTLLEGIVADPDQHLSELPCLTEGERQQLLVRRHDAQAICSRLGDRILATSDNARPELEQTLVTPPSALEHELTKIWEQVLGVQPVGVRDNFFDLGGHSLLAVRLFAQIGKMMGKSPPLATIFHAPTIEQLANILRREEWSSPTSSLVALQPGGSKPPFFCLPGNLGNVFTDLGDLARHLGPNQPFYGFQDGMKNPAQIQALATRFLFDVRAVQPEDPYLLGGVCSGGVVAFEMAQQLRAQGQHVALLALIETPQLRVPSLRSYFDFVTYLLHHVGQRSGHHSPSVSQRNSAGWRDYVRLKMKFIANVWALTRYTPQPYPGRVHLFLTQESLRSVRGPGLGWRELATGGAEVHVIPGTHNAITRTYDAIPEESHLQVLAEQLKVCIDDAVVDEYSS